MKTLLSIITLLILTNSYLFHYSNSLKTQSSKTENTNLISIPTQIPKSYDKHLLTSQELYQKALQLQSTYPSQAINYFNQSIQEVTTVIIETSSPIAYALRGRFYASLMQSHPQFIDIAISDLLSSEKNSETLQILANLYTAKGDLASSLPYFQALGDTNQVNAIQNLIKQIPQTSTSNTTPQPPEVAPLLHANSLADFIIASPQNNINLNTSSTTYSNAHSGQAILLKNQSSVKITNKNITSSSQVYITTLSGGKNQPISVISKTNNSAEFGLPNPSLEDITIKWWIIN